MRPQPIRPMGEWEPGVAGVGVRGTRWISSGTTWMQGLLRHPAQRRFHIDNVVPVLSDRAVEKATISRSFPSSGTWE
jgi:hypothetical protein